MHRIRIATFLFALVAGTQTPQSLAQANGDAAAPAPASFEAARELAATGRLDKALAQLNELAAQAPEPPGVERLRGMIFYRREQFPEAIEAFAKAAAQDASDRESIEMQGVSLFRMGRSADALPLLEKAHAAVDRANIDPQYVLGLCYADARRFDDARRAFAAQYGFAPESAEAYLLAGRLFLRHELTDEATIQAQKALAINPSLPLAHQLLGEVALAKADLPGAISELEAERKLNPLNGALYDRLGDALIRSGRYVDAQRALNQAALLEPASTAPYILLGDVFLKLNNPIQALHYLDHAEKMDPSNFMTHNLLAKAYKATGQLAESAREYKMVVELQNGHLAEAAGK